MRSAYSYVIIKENYPDMERQSALLHNNYKASKRYALISKVVNRDNSESIAFVDYSNDLQALQDRAKGYVSWYNYPLGIAKNIQGYLSELP
jgi:hypothetical protein